MPSIPTFAYVAQGTWRIFGDDVQPPTPVEENVIVKKTTKKITSATPANICPSCLKEMVEIDFDGFSHECECGTLRYANGTILSAAA